MSAAGRTPRFRDLVEVLERRAAEQPEVPAIVHLADGETEAARLDFGALAGAARGVAARLAELGAAGEPVAICLPNGPEYAVSVLGCLIAGAIAVPANAPEAKRLTRTLPRLQSILRDSGARRVLCGTDAGELIASLAGEGELPPLDCVVPSACPPEDAPRRPARTGEPALLVYTSGSTGDPKGVVLDHANLLHNLEHLPGVEERPVTAIVTWLPFFHDLGLMMGVLHPVYRGRPAICMPPEAFVQRPLRWLEAASRWRASTLAAPNFGFELCVRRGVPASGADLDLSCVNLALNGAEPVRAATLERFCAAFAPFGFRAEAFYPSFGLTDATATVTGRAALAPPTVLELDRSELQRGRAVPAAGGEAAARSVALVGCGVGLDGQRLAIVDPDSREELPAGRVGEIWVAGPCVGRGYWRRPQESGERYGAVLAGVPEDGSGLRFLRTGDLGFLDQRGELFVTGRLSDLIVLQGINHYPEDLEPTVAECHPGLRPGSGTVFSVELGDAERLVVVQEVDESAAAAAEPVLAAIRAALVERHDVEPWTILLVPPGAVPKTSSRKVRRRACRDAFLAGSLEALARWTGSDAPPSTGGDGPAHPSGEPASGAGARVAAIRRWLIEHFAARVGVPPERIATGRPLAELGLPSVEAVTMAGELASWLGRPVPPTVAWDHPTIDELARHLGADVPEPAARPAARPAADEPIAVIGMACRMPRAEGLDGYWRLLAGGTDAVEEVPPDRWDVAAFFDPDPASPGRMVSRWGAFVTGLEEFDPAFFGISPREARHLDPRQRLMLELAWEALEHAGIPHDRLAGSDAGVFVAVLTDDYSDLLYGDLRRVDAYSGSGVANSVVANRLSYCLDLRGPSLAVDTACSGSLVAIHLACQALRQGECGAAFAGGVSLNLLPHGNIFFSRAGALSPSGRCRTFDRAADGIVRSDGAGMLLLKPLARALEDGDPVLAVIRGSAVNQDGRSNGLMAPSRPAQERVLREAYRRAGVDPGDVGYVETHGTGTPLGDPIEVGAIAAVLGAGRREPCVLGSVKTNVGHTEAAAGVAGLIKAVLALEHEEIPPNLHLETLNPLIAADGFDLVVPREPHPWPRREGRRRIAGVSSFGFGGTNAHVVVEEWDDRERRAAWRSGRREPVPLVLSAADPDVLRALAGAFAGPVEAVGDEGLSDLCRAVAVRRTPMRHRLALTATSAEQTAAALRRFAAGEASAADAGSAPSGDPPAPVLAFSGQGSHWLGMGRELISAEPVFAAAIERCDAAFRDLGGGGLAARLRDGEEAGEGTAAVQPAVFAVQVALYELWRSWGIAPAAVVGQSLGEAAAAYAAGALSLEDAARVVFHRSRLMARVEGEGATAVVALSRRDAELAAAGFDGALAVAGTTGRETTVVAGEAGAVARFVAAMTAREVFAREIPGVRIAFHTPHMDPLAAELEDALAGLSPAAPSVPLLSTVTGGWVDGPELGAGYWARNLRQPFLLAEVLDELIDSGYPLFLEIAPDAVLTGSISRQLAGCGAQGTVIASVRREGGELASLRQALGRLWTAGAAVDWRRVFPGPAPWVALPRYPWRRQRFWFDQIELPQSAGRVRSPSAERRRSGGHALLVEPRQSAASPGASWEMELGVDTFHYLRDHRVQGVTLVPAALYVEMGAAAAATVLPADAVEVRDLRFEHALFLHHDRPQRLQLAVTTTAPGVVRFEVYSTAADADPGRPGGGWVRHAAGTASPAAPVVAGGDPAALRRRLSRRVEGEELYRRLGQLGMQFGPGFRVLAHALCGEGEALARLELPPGAAAEAGAYRVHPVLVDGLLQAVAAAQPPDLELGEAFLPVGIDRAVLPAAAGTSLWAHCTMDPATSRELQRANVAIYDDSGAAVGCIEGLRLQRVGTHGEAESVGSWLYQPRWQPLEAPPARPRELSPGAWLVLADRRGCGAALAERLRARGEAVLEVHAGDGSVAGDRGFDGWIDAVHESDRPLRGVIHLWSLDLPPAAALEAADLDRAQRLGCGAAVRAVQALIHCRKRHGLTEPPRLWMVTGAAQREAAAGGPEGLAAAALWGLGRGLFTEEGAALGKLIDLAPGVAPEAAAELVDAELGFLDDEFFVSHAGGERRVQRLARAELRGAPPPVRLRADGTYWVTGAFGGLGAEVARWLVAHGARHLVLITRSHLPPRTAWSEIEAGSPAAGRVAGVLDLEREGVSVTPVALDLTDAAAVEALVARHRAERRPPVRGVFHCAAVLADRPVLGLDDETLGAVLEPKVQGAWNLHRALAGEPLDHFVLFSSIAALLGNYGQVHYSAGNAFLDALAQHRRALGLPGLSIEWGPWAGVGEAARRDLGAQHREGGMEALTVAQGLAALEALIGAPGAQYAAMRPDWPVYCRGQARVPSLIADLARRPAQVAAAAGAAEPAGLAARLEGLQGAPRVAELTLWLRELVASVLRSVREQVPADESLQTLGLDSIMAAEVKREIDGELGQPVPLTLLLSASGLGDLARALDERWLGGAPEAAEPVAAGAGREIRGGAAE